MPDIAGRSFKTTHIYSSVSMTLLPWLHIFHTITLPMVTMVTTHQLKLWIQIELCSRVCLHHQILTFLCYIHCKIYLQPFCGHFGAWLLELLQSTWVAPYPAVSPLRWCDYLHHSHHHSHLCNSLQVLNEFSISILPHKVNQCFLDLALLTR